MNRTIAMTAVIVSLPLALAACGGGSGESTPPSPAKQSSPPAEAPAAEVPAAEASGGQIPTPPAGAFVAGPEDDALLDGADLENGAQVYQTICLACHQADGMGMNGVLAGNFVDDKTILAKTNGELLHSIAEGVQGTMAAMPPWKHTVDEQGRKDALAYVRATYGGPAEVTGD